MSMIKILDLTIIEFAQWLVRQLELFTPLTRTDINNFFLLTLKWSIVVFWLITLMEFACKETLLGFFGILNANISIKFYMILKKEFAEQDQKSDLLPIEIVTHMRIRTTMLKFFLLLVAPVYLFVLVIWDHFPLTCFIVISGAILFTEITLEYLLCTMSLPPAEKQRREIEKETQNMVPAKI